MDYPSTLPSATVAGSAVTLSYGLGSTTFENGRSRQRRKTKREMRSLSLSYVLTGPQLWGWQSWANENGYNWHYEFIVTDYSGIRSGAPMRHYIRYTSDITIEAAGINLYRVFVSAEMGVATLPEDLFTQTDDVIFGGRPGAPSTPDVISAETEFGIATDQIKAGYPGFNASIPDALFVPTGDVIFGGRPVSPSTPDVISGETEIGIATNQIKAGNPGLTA